MNWSIDQPVTLGFYWVSEAGQPPHIVEIQARPGFEQTPFVILPGDDKHYPIELYRKALWYGPLVAPGIH